MKKFCLGFIFLFFSTLMAQERSVTETVHNLSISGHGKISATNETQVCIFCHISHKGSPDAPLWNRSTTQTNFELFPNQKLIPKGTLRNQPQGASRICLSCHDGTISLLPRRSGGEHIELSNVGPGAILPDGRTKLGTILSDDHPVSIPIDPSNNKIQIIQPTTGSKSIPQDWVECTSCHDAHNNQFGKFLVKNNTHSELCLDCHFFMDWEESSHGNSYEGKNQKMLELGCSACHIVHAAPVADNLLIAWEENLCFKCHDANKNDDSEVATDINLMTEFNKPSRHPIDVNPGMHQSNEGPYLSYPQPTAFIPEINVNSQRHVECVDCHNPHSVKPASLPMQISGTLNNVWGINSDGQKIEYVVNEHQICYKCHSSSKNLPEDQSDKMLEFTVSNPSFHPVEGPGVNMNVPSLLPPWNVQSTIKCTDCHNNDDVGGPQGPHGSSYFPILELNYTTSNKTNESEFEYALCYKCHDRNSILGDMSFPYHSLHIIKEKASCYTCHDSHGSQYFAHLISFDKDWVYRARGKIEFIDYGTNSGACYLTCHKVSHNPKVYP